MAGPVRQRGKRRCATRRAELGCGRSWVAAGREETARAQAQAGEKGRAMGRHYWATQRRGKGKAMLGSPAWAGREGEAGRRGREKNELDQTCFKLCFPFSFLFLYFKTYFKLVSKAIQILFEILTITTHLNKLYAPT